MKKTNFLFIAILFIFCSAFISPNRNVHDFLVKDIMGNDVSLSRYKGKVLLIVNVASKCGLTPQYKDLQKLYEEYGTYGLEVMGFPANNFLNQEPAENEEINRFCTQKYGVTFPMFSKISVKGKKKHPLYKYLTEKEKNKKFNAPVQWNFQKFLVNAKGQVIKSFPPTLRVIDRKCKKLIQTELLKINNTAELKDLVKKERTKNKKNKKKTNTSKKANI